MECELQLEECEVKIIECELTFQHLISKASNLISHDRLDFQILTQLNNLALACNLILYYLDTDSISPTSLGGFHWSFILIRLALLVSFFP